MAPLISAASISYQLNSFGTVNFQQFTSKEVTSRSYEKQHCDTFPRQLGAIDLNRVLLRQNPQMYSHLLIYMKCTFYHLKVYLFVQVLYPNMRHLQSVID